MDEETRERKDSDGESVCERIKGLLMCISNNLNMNTEKILELYEF